MCPVNYHEYNYSEHCSTSLCIFYTPSSALSVKQSTEVFGIGRGPFDQGAHFHAGGPYLRPRLWPWPNPRYAYGWRNVKKYWSVIQTGLFVATATFVAASINNNFFIGLITCVYQAVYLHLVGQIKVSVDCKPRLMWQWKQIAYSLRKIPICICFFVPTQ